MGAMTQLIPPPHRVLRLGRLCTQALIAEADLTPKPALVDRRGSGAHTDLSLDLMRRSALVLEASFAEMAIVSAGACPSQALRELLARIGREAEGAMLCATLGSNTHRGAIWVLGLMVGAAAMHKESDPAAPSIATTAGEIAKFEDRAAPRSVSHGDLVAGRFGVDGARGEARRGFPRVIDIGLPMLRARRREGAAEAVARIDALLSIMSVLADTCLLYRGGEVALVTAQEGASAVLRAGGSGTRRGRELLHRLDAQLVRQNASPGGSADLLAATLLLDAIERGSADIQTTTGLMEEDLWNVLS